MNCDEFRLIVGAEPGSTRADVILHASECARCAAYQSELQEMDRAIFRALQVDAVQATSPNRPEISGRRSWQIAAGVVFALVTALMIWLASPRQSFAQQVVEHVQNEPKSLVSTLDLIPDAELTRVLSRSGVRLKPGVARVSYAMSCWFRGHYVPHLVVQTPDGPVTVLIMPRERTVTRAETLNEEDFAGVIVPAPRGVMVVLSQQASVEQVSRIVLSALEYET